MNFNGRTLFSPILPLIEDEFGVAHARAASIFTFISFGYALALFSSGMINGRLGSKRTILASLVISACIFFFIPTIHTFNLFYPVAFLMAFALGVYLPTIIPIITEYYEAGVWGKAIAIHESASSFSIFAAPFIALFLLTFLPWRAIFMVMGGVALLSALVFHLTATEIDQGGSGHKFNAGLLKRREIWIMGTLWIFCSGCILGLYFILPLYLVKELGMDVRYANSVFGFSRAGMVVVAIAAGFVADRVNVRTTFFFVVLATGVMTMLLAVKDVRLIKPLLFIQATISGSFPPLALVAISRMFDRQSRGQATGFIITLGMIGTGIIPYLIGLTGDLVTFRLGIFLLGFCTFLASGLLYFLKETR
jgi:MFS family permease